MACLDVTSKLKQAARAGRGFMLLDLLLSIALLAMLLASVAAAVDATTSGYAENQKISASTQAARAVLDRICRDIRTADAIDAGSSSSTLIITPPADSGSGITQIKYATDGAGLLNYTVTTSSGATTYPLLGESGDEVSVRTFTIIREIGEDSEGNSCVISVTMRLEFEVDNQVLGVTASASPRRNQEY